MAQIRYILASALESLTPVATLTGTAGTRVEPTGSTVIGIPAQYLAQTVEVGGGTPQAGAFGSEGIVCFDWQVFASTASEVVSASANVPAAPSAPGSYYAFPDEYAQQTIGDEPVPVVEDPGTVTTNGANLTTAAIAGTNPPAMVHGVWITAPDVMAAETTLWLNTIDDAGTPRQAYVTVYDDGARMVSIYTRSGDVLQPAVSEYITNDPIQPGDRVFLALSVSAGGTLHSYQSRNGADFTRGTGVAITTGHTMPIYGAPHRFYDSDNIHTEGSFLWARASLPAAFADLASMNAAKSSFVTADGSRATLNGIYAVLGEPLHAIYGTATDYNAATDRGTSAGALTLSGTFADYVPPAPYAPSVVQSTNQSLSVTTAAGTPTMWAAIVANWSYDVAGTAGNAHAWRTSKYGGGNLRFNGSGVPVATVGVPTSLATTATDTLSGQRIHAAGEGASAILTLETNGTSGAAKLYEMAADGTISLAETYNFSDMTAFDMREAVITLLASNKTISTGGVGMWAGTGTIPAINPVTSPRDFFDLDGRPTGRDALSAIFGAQPMVAEFGDAAAWLDTTTDGTEAGIVTFGTTPKEGTITDVPFEGASSLIAASDSDADLLAGTAANYSLTQSVVESFGTGDFDYSGVTLTASKPSICLGEAVYLEVTGLTDEQRGTWGFLWEFDTSGEFQFLDGCPWHIRQRNRAVGHHQTAAWNKGDGPGAKVVKVHIVPPVWTGLKGKTLSVTVTNRDPDVEFAGITVYVATDGDFTGVPAEVGATERVTTFADGYSRLKAWDGGRMRFKRGQTIPITSHIEISRAYLHGVMFDDWGSTANPLPILDISTEGLSWKRPEAVPFYVIANLNHVGAYDGVTGTVATSPVMTPSAYAVNAQGASITLNGCKFEKMMKAAEITNASGGLGNHLSVYDCNITRWQDFGLYTAEVDPHVRGCAIYQDPDYLANWDEGKNYNGPIDYANHGPMRFNKMSNRTVIVSQLRCFSFTDWGGGGNSTIFGASVPIVAGQPILRMGALDCENANALVTEIYSEGGGYSLGGGNSGYTVGSGFLAMHGCYHLLNAIWNKTSFGMTGAWCRDNVFLVPAGVPAGTNENVYSVFNGISDDQVTATWHTKPINCFNNTVVFLKSAADINNNAPSFAQIMEVAPDNASLVDLPVINIYDNVLWAPNITLSGEVAPRVPAGLTRTGRYGPLPMYKGWHQVHGGTDLGLYPEFATPATAPELPIAGATYEGRGAGDATKPHGALDFHGRIRSERDQGAVSYEVLKPA